MVLVEGLTHSRESDTQPGCQRIRDFNLELRGAASGEAPMSLTAREAAGFLANTIGPDIDESRPEAELLLNNETDPHHYRKWFYLDGAVSLASLHDIAQTLSGHKMKLTANEADDSKETTYTFLKHYETIFAAYAAEKAPTLTSDELKNILLINEELKQLFLRYRKLSY